MKLTASSPNSLPILEQSVRMTKKARVTKTEISTIKRMIGVKHPKYIKFDDGHQFIPFNHIYKFEGVLGSGGFGIVFKVIFRENGERYAIKVRQNQLILRL